MSSIIERIASIDKKYLEGYDLTSIPDTEVEFLDWWWSTQAVGCVACPLSASRSQVVKPDGKFGAKIMVVGEGPGFLENLTGLPLTGPMELRSSHCSSCNNVNQCFSHKLLTEPNGRMKANKVVTCTPNYKPISQLDGRKFYLRSAGTIIDGILLNKWGFKYPRHNWVESYNKIHDDAPLKVESPFYFTNVTLCRTTDINGLKDGLPSGISLKACKKWFTFQWAAIQPDIIIALGHSAFSTLTGSKLETIKVNTIVDSKFGKVIGNFHPSYYMRQDNQTVKAYSYAKIAQTFEISLGISGLL